MIVTGTTNTTNATDRSTVFTWAKLYLNMRFVRRVKIGISNNKGLEICTFIQYGFKAHYFLLFSLVTKDCSNALFCKLVFEDFKECPLAKHSARKTIEDKTESE